MGKELTHVTVSSIISQLEPADTYITSIFEPSNDVVGQCEGGKAKHIDSAKRFQHRNMREKLHLTHSEHRAHALESIFDNRKNSNR